MAERIYALLLKLYPEHFRRAYGDEAILLVHERVRVEKGFRSGLRLWLDLLADFAISLPREYSKARKIPSVAAQPVSGEVSFQLLAERSLNPMLLFPGGVLSAVLFWGCVSSVAHSRMFPALFQDPLSLQGLVQSNLALARSHTDGAYSFCVTANRDIPANSGQPLLTLHFAPPGGSGTALIDGNVVNTFRNQQHLPIRAEVSAGDHELALHLDQPATNSVEFNNANLKYCSSNAGSELR